jgi:hypothetical protein
MSLLDFEQGKRPTRFRLKPPKLLIALGSVCALVLGYTFAGNINLNDDQAVEFGQGVVQTTACDQDGLIVTPYSEFVNGDSNFTPIELDADSSEITNGRLLYTNDTDFSSIRVGDSVTGSGIPAGSFITNISLGGVFAINNSYSEKITTRTLTISRPVGRFLLSEIEIADVDSRSGKCANKAFTIKVYNSTGSSPLATYELFNTGSEFTSGSGMIQSNFENEEKAEMFLMIEEPTVASTDVYRITIESKDQINLELGRIGLWAGTFFCGPGSEDCLIPTSSSEFNNEFYCDEVELFCNIVFLPATDFLQLQVDQCEAEQGEQCQEAAALRLATWSLLENDTDDPEMGWQILISVPGSFGDFQGNIHLDGQILYSNGQYAVFRWYVNTGDASNPGIERSYSDLIISFSGSLPITTSYDGESGLPIDAPLYELSWTY